MAVIPERAGPLLDEAADLAAWFERAGHTLYLVGGVVRDTIVNRLDRNADLDFTTDARPDDIEAIVRPVAGAVWTQGKSFGTIGLNCLLR